MGEFTAEVVVLMVVLDGRIEGDEGVLAADVDAVVHLPVHVPHLASRVEEAL